MTKIRRGDVLYVAVPTTDGSRLIRRPALVVQDPNLRTAYENLILAVITSRVETEGPGRIFVSANSPEGKEMGLKTDSLITLDNLVTVAKWMVVKDLGHCSVMVEVDRELRRVLAL